jgi:hypothetical protein
MDAFALLLVIAMNFSALGVYFATLQPVKTPHTAALAKPTLAQSTLAQPTLAQPTLAQPTLAQPTLIVPTLAQPALHPVLRGNVAVARLLRGEMIY